MERAMQDDDTLSPAGRQSAPDAVWEQARQDYLAGLSAAQVCRRHGLNVATLRSRCSREAWRRSDQPWVPRARLDPEDEGVVLEERVDGNLDLIEPRELSYVASRRMMRAALRGDAAEAVRWRRVRDMMDEEQADLDRFIAEENEWMFQHANRFAAEKAEDTPSSDSSGSSSATPDPG
jgi:hypothetical protein